jgi:hypothetical protein
MDMSNEQRQQVQVAQAETSTTSEQPKWGELPPPKRIAVLEARLAEWEQLPAEARVDPAKGEGRSAFDQKGPQAWQGGTLTGADVFYFAARTLAGSAQEAAISEAAESLRTTDFVEQFIVLDVFPVHLDGADLFGAHLDGAHLFGAHLDGADLSSAHLDGTVLSDAHLEGAVLSDAHLDGAHLDGAHLEGANLTGASFDKASRLINAILSGASFDQVTFDNTNLTVIDWSLVRILGDERRARERKGNGGKPKQHAQRLDEYKSAARANCVLAVALEAQGLVEDADRFALRARVLQRRVLRLQGPRRWPAYAGSLVLAALAGYGYRLPRIFLAYAIVVLAFAGAYYATGLLPTEHPLSPDEALVLSLTTIHGRVFTSPFSLDSVQAKIAAAQAVLGLVIEGIFVAMLIKRFFGR